jgi:hypothetical protein
MDNEQQILDLVRKALSVDSATGTSISPYIKEDLEDEGYLQLYSETDPAQMALLKDLPRQQAQQVNHEFVLIDRYGNHKTKAAFAANALPPQANIEGTRKFVNLKLYGKTSAVQGLTVLQNTVRALGQSDIAAANDMAVRLLLMYQINADLFASDTRFTLDANVFKGCWQLIDELTASPSATTPFSNTDIFIDLRGQPLLPDGPQGIRSAATGFTKRNAQLRRIYMAPEILETIENNLDPAARLQIGAQALPNNKGVIIGNSVDGMRVQGSTVYFRRDSVLSSMARTGTPNTVSIPGAPAAFTFGGSGAGTSAQPAVNASGVGKWASSGERLTGVIYQVTAVNEVGESLASNTSNAVNATAGKTVEFQITPRGNELSFRVYRGYNTDLSQPGTFMQPVSRTPQFVFEVPNGMTVGNTTPFTIVDADLFIPGTTWAWGTDVWSPNAEAIDRGEAPSSPTNEYTVGRSAAAVAQLTGLFEFDLAKLGWLFSNKLFAQVLAPQVPRPFANVVWMNVGGNEVKSALLDRPS